MGITHQVDDPDNPILVISTSFGGGGYGGSCDSEFYALTQAAADVVSAGIVIFASSGNSGYCGEIACPACISHATSVGALYDADISGSVGWCVSSDSCAENIQSYTDCSTGYAAWDSSPLADQVAPFSNVSDALNLFAPAYQASTTKLGGGFVSSFGGTSAACPYAAGIAAVMQSAAKAATGSFLTPAQVKARLTEYGDPISYAAAGITRPRPNLASTDIDDDGIPAGWEIAYFSNLTRDGSGDFDTDGLTDLEEYLEETFPDDSDSDDDGFSDGAEVAAGTDPLDNGSYPLVVTAMTTSSLILAGTLLFIIGLLRQHPWDHSTNSLRLRSQKTMLNSVCRIPGHEQNLKPKHRLYSLPK